MSRSPLRSSWCIPLLIAYTSKKEYQQKTAVELLAHFLIDTMHF